MQYNCQLREINGCGWLASRRWNRDVRDADCPCFVTRESIVRVIARLQRSDCWNVCQANRANGNYANLRYALCPEACLPACSKDTSVSPSGHNAFYRCQGRQCCTDHCNSTLRNASKNWATTVVCVWVAFHVSRASACRCQHAPTTNPTIHGANNSVQARSGIYHHKHNGIKQHTYTASQPQLTNDNRNRNNYSNS